VLVMALFEEADGLLWVGAKHLVEVLDDDFSMRHGKAPLAISPHPRPGARPWTVAGTRHGPARWRGRDGWGWQGECATRPGPCGTSGRVAQLCQSPRNVRF